MSVLALVPARSGSKGIAHKNFRQLGGKPLWRLALDCADAAGCDLLRITSGWDAEFWNVANETGRYGIVRRPDELCSDTAAMIDVVKHALADEPGPPEQIVVLLQPTAVFRKPEHIIHAVNLLQESGADSVVSVVPLPLTHSWECQLRLQEYDGRGRVKYPTLRPVDLDKSDLMDLPKRRQEAEQTYIRDGTCYAFRRATVERYNSIYGYKSVPLLIDPADSCELDTEDDWKAVERRWAERATTPRS